MTECTITCIDAHGATYVIYDGTNAYKPERSESSGEVRGQEGDRQSSRLNKATSIRLLRHKRSSKICILKRNRLAHRSPVCKNPNTVSPLMKVLITAVGGKIANQRR